VQSLLLRPSRDLGALAVEHVRSRSFESRQPGLFARLLRRVADAWVDADLLSNLLFDGEYARQLIELGRADARAQHEALCRFFDSAAPDRAAQPLAA
jgi:NTE family protein